ncbi:hypothetical protein P5V15_007107 [Pogonomyrmex californicus]
MAPYLESNNNVSNFTILDALPSPPLVLLGLRASLKEDINVSAAELVYGTSLSLPSNVVARPTTNNKSSPHGNKSSPNESRKKSFERRHKYVTAEIAISFSKDRRNASRENIAKRLSANS